MLHRLLQCYKSYIRCLNHVDNVINEISYVYVQLCNYHRVWGTLDVAKSKGFNKSLIDHDSITKQLKASFHI